MGSGKQRWRLSFHKTKNQTPPKEFMCPISGSLMSDPVIVSSGHTFERNCVVACKSLNFTPMLPDDDSSSLNFSTIISNRALKSTILSWCSATHIDPPRPIDPLSAEKIVRTLMHAQPRPLIMHLKHITTSSDESLSPSTGPTTPLPLCYSSSSSSEIDQNPCQEHELVYKMKSSLAEQEEAIISLREITRTKEETRVQLCTPRLLSALRGLITSRYSSLQVNSIAAVVNLSLEDRNKVMIVRSGIVPSVIDVLKGGFRESQEHAAGALFSLALDDQNKTAIGVLGALPPLLHSLRADSERTRHDSALALYHLSLVQSNRTKLVKLGAVQTLLGMVRGGHMTGRVLLILCNMAASHEGRGAMLDGGAVECFVGMLQRGVFDSEAIRESYVTALYGLSHGGLRFKGLAKEAAAEEMLIKLEEILVSVRAKDKVKRILEVLRQKDEEEEEVDWEELLNSDDDISRAITRTSSV